jgi:hypothetical protein
LNDEEPAESVVPEPVVDVSQISLFVLSAYLIVMHLYI